MLQPADTAPPPARPRPRPGVPLPPGPKLPVLVQTPLHWLLRHRFLPAMRRRYGDVFTIDVLPGGPITVLADPALVKEVFTGSPQTFHAGEGNRLLALLLGPRSVLTADGDQHLADRKLLLPAFHGRQVQRTLDTMAELTREEVARWPVGTPFRTHPRFQELTLAIIVRVVFGATDPAVARELSDALRAVLKIEAWHLPAFDDPRRTERWPWKGLGRRIAAADRVILRVVAERRAAGATDGDDVLSMLLEASGDEVDDRWLRDQLVTLLVAGHETTAASLAWSLERLLRTPHALRRLEEGLDRDADPYRDAVAKEVLRVRPVIHDVARRLKQDVQVGPHLLPEGLLVMPSIGLLHADPRLHGDAAAFRPERWLDDGEGAPPYSWIPFGGGVRRCLGAAFATAEMTTVLRTVLQEVELRAPDPRDEPAKMDHITVVPSKGATVEVVRRRRGAAGR